MAESRRKTADSGRSALEKKERSCVSATNEVSVKPQLHVCSELLWEEGENFSEQFFTSDFGVFDLQTWKRY